MPEPVFEPRGELSIRTLAMPADTNPSGDIFGGWLLSQMDIAGAISAQWRAKGRVATIAIEAMEFHRPVWVGDVLCCYSEIIKVGSSSITVRVEAWVRRSRHAEERIKVTEGTFTYVALDEAGNKHPVSRE
ncbi:MAG: acyl-CoA thioesterase [Rhodospirillales bacterium]|nr:acyl-CoA thioesterase [Rhodospirillales bacterium]